MSPASSYDALGWKLIRVNQRAGHSIEKGWPDHPVPPEEIGKNWIGVLTGRASGVFDLDVDRKGGKDGPATLAGLEGKFGALPETLRMRSPHGTHNLFRCPPGRLIRNGANVLGPGLDIKGERGYFLAPPSDGREWLNWGQEIAEAPEWLLNLIELRGGSPSRKLGVIQQYPDVLCPAHKDVKPSLSVALSETGKIVFNCFADCSPQAIMDAWGVGWEAMFPKAEEVTIIGSGWSALCPVEDLDTEIEPEFVIDRLLPVGLCVLAGAEKIGKSIAVANMADGLARGTIVFDDFTVVRPGPTIYLSFEDNKRRVKGRFAKLGTPPGMVHVLTMENLGGWFFDTPKGMADLRSGIEKLHPSLVVIDTLSRGREGDNRKKKDSYQFDVDTLAPLQCLALQFGIAIILITHTARSRSGTGIDSIIGSRGITATADTLMALQRHRRTRMEAVLHVTGRDVESQDFSLLFDGTNLRWHLNQIVILDDALDIGPKLCLLPGCGKEVTVGNYCEDSHRHRHYRMIRKEKESHGQGSLDD